MPFRSRSRARWADIEATGRDALFDFYHRRIRPEHLVVSASGPFEGDEVAAELEASYRFPARDKAMTRPILSSPRRSFIPSKPSRPVR